MLTWRLKRLLRLFVTLSVLFIFWQILDFPLFGPSFWKETESRFDCLIFFFGILTSTIIQLIWDCTHDNSAGFDYEHENFEII